MVYSLWFDILMGVGYDIPTSGLTSLVQKRKETTMSKEDEKFTGFNGLSASDITVTIDGKPLSSFNTDTITLSTLKEIEHDTVVLNTDVKQGDLFNGWPEDGPPVTVTLLKEDND